MLDPRGQLLRTLRLIGLTVVIALAVVPLVVDAHEQRNEPEAYRIGPEDVLRISVWKNDALSGTVSVRPDGKFSLPLINDVRAAGLTVRELRDVITEKLREFVPNPEVSVIDSDVRSLKISVIGGPTRPDRYELPIIPSGHRFVVLVPGEHGALRRLGSYSREQLQSMLDLCRTSSEEVCDEFKNAIILVP